MKRTHYCGEVKSAGEKVVVGGFVKKSRRLGSLIFADLRDRTGIVQLAFDDNTDRELFALAESLRSEFTLLAEGTVREREKPNPDLPTGNVEIFVEKLTIYSEAHTPPFDISDETNAGEELRLRYRYLDLRRPALQKNLITRSKITKAARDYFYDNGFIEIDTPCLMKSTPEGARDYLVPSRVHPGSFYALPQSPQIYKQLLMVSGFDRYIQIAKCFRDEDLRADRQPEFTQIDLEMSFVDVEDILSVAEGFIKKVFADVLGTVLPEKFPRLKFKEAMETYGSDKPDTRFGNTIKDGTALFEETEFPVFANAAAEGGKIRFINVKNAAAVYTRKEIDKLIEYARGIGAKGVPYIRYAEDVPSCSFGKFLKEGDIDKIINAAEAEKGDLLLFAAGADRDILPLLGQLRNVTAAKLGITDKNAFNFLWITDFPFFEQNAETGSWEAMHHPFTMPNDECLDILESDPGKVYAKAYDLVVNGVELSSGSIRITDYKLQQKMFELLGLSAEEIEAKFGFLVEAYKYGSPPHGGMGIGLDRLTMIICGAESLRDVTAFPKVQNASELMSGCPAPVDKASTDALGIDVRGLT
jgi:aspartyl-tRNA synthetase